MVGHGLLLRNGTCLTMTYRIEPATVVHLPWLRLLFTRWVAEQPMTYPLMDEEEFDNFTINIARNLTTNPQFYLGVAIIGRRVVGFLGGEVIERPIGKPHLIGRGHWLYIVPKHRGKGVAKQLIADGLRWLSTSGATVVELAELAVTNNAWERRGWTPFLANYYLPITAIFDRLAPLVNGHLAPLTSERAQEPFHVVG